MAIQRIARLIGPMLVLLASAGCASPVRPSGLLANVPELPAGKHLDRFWADRDRIAAGRSSRIVLGEVTERVSDRPKVQDEEALAWLQTALRDREGEVFLADDRDGRTARLDVTITEMNPGSVFQRILGGEVGAGHAWIQVEGLVRDAESEELLAAFADRRRASGAWGVRDVAGDAGPAMIREMLEGVASDARLELREAFSLDAGRTASAPGSASVPCRRRCRSAPATARS